MAGAWSVPELSAALAPLLPGLRVEVVAEIDSTNTELMRRARAGDTAPVLLVAERQTAGRGRLGRAWCIQGVEPGTQAASLMFSLGLPFGLVQCLTCGRRTPALVSRPQTLLPSPKHWKPRPHRPTASLL